MKTLPLTAMIALLVGGCAGSPIIDDEVAQVAATLDYGDYTSATLATRAWEALAEGDDTKVLAYTAKCIELYGEQGAEMNAELTAYAPIEKVNDYWALNDAGTCTYIQATVYEERKMYPQAAKSFQSLADDYYYAQTWDPNGWYWYPAAGAADKAKKYKYK